MVVSIVLYGCTSWTLMKRIEKKKKYIYIYIYTELMVISPHITVGMRVDSVTCLYMKSDVYEPSRKSYLRVYLIEIFHLLFTLKCHWLLEKIFTSSLFLLSNYRYEPTDKKKTQSLPIMVGNGKPGWSHRRINSKRRKKLSSLFSTRAYPEASLIVQWLMRESGRQ